MEDEEVGFDLPEDEDDDGLFTGDEDEGQGEEAPDPEPAPLSEASAEVPPREQPAPHAPVILDPDNLFTDAEREHLAYLQETDPIAAISAVMERRNRFTNSCRQQFESRINSMAALNPMVASVREDINRLAESVDVSQLQYPDAAANLAKLAIGNAIMEGRLSATQQLGTTAAAPKPAPPVRAAQPAAARTPAAQGASRAPVATSTAPRGIADYLKQSLGLTDEEAATIRNHRRGGRI